MTTSSASRVILVMEASIGNSVFEGEAGRGAVRDDGCGGKNAADVDATRIASLLQRIARGETGALAELYDSCAGRLYALALWRTGSREDAADVVQEVFVRLTREGERLARVRRPLPYLLRMTHNLAVTVLRRRRSDASIDELLVADPGHGAEARLAARQAAGMLSTLPPKQREALYLRHFEGLSYREIGAVTGVPTFTAASRCRNGLARLRRLMGVSK